MRETRQSTEPGAVDASNVRLEMIEGAPWPMAAVMGASHVVSQVNPGFSRLLDLPGSDLLGKPFSEVVPAHAEWISLLDRVYQTGRPESYAAPEGGSQLGGVWSSTMWPILEAERPVGVVIQVMDAVRRQEQIVAMNEALLLGALRQLEEVENARAEAVAANRAKDQFLAVLSHELRTPLTPVLMAVHTHLRNKDLAPCVAETLTMIEQNVRFEARLIDDLLDFSSVGCGKLFIFTKLIDAHEIMRKAIGVVTSDIEDKHQRLTVALDAIEHRLIGDGARLRQVFTNLLKNASKFTPVSGEIWVRSRNEPASPDAPARLVVEVSDTGIGFSTEANGQIFEPFRQASETVTREFGGLGLGLAISKAIIDAHSGVIHAQSLGAGRGATFTVELILPDSSHLVEDPKRL